MVLMENDSACGLTFIGKEGFDGHPEIFSVLNTLGI